MKFGVRTPSLKKSFKAKTTSKISRKIKKAVNPAYSTKYVSIAHPKRKIKNKIYQKRTFSFFNLFR